MSACVKCGEPAAHVLVTVPFHREFPITVRHRCPGCDTVFDEPARDNASVLTAALRGTGLVVLREDEVQDGEHQKDDEANDDGGPEGRREYEKRGEGDEGKPEATAKRGEGDGHAPASVSPPQEPHGLGPCPYKRRSAENPNAFWACHAAPGDLDHCLPPNAQGIGDWRTLP